jgi:hypothetical protein
VIPTIERGAGKTHDLGFSVMCLTTFNLSTWRKSGQESIILIFLNFLFGQSTTSSLGRFGLLRSNLLKFRISFVADQRQGPQRWFELTCASV